ncbi:MAG: hypothetical protein HYS27_14895 [Deltaproteobacteria bacterium]|nr:hypothetical protein [Deltaproteobacteria bacterium]
MRSTTHARLLLFSLALLATTAPLALAPIAHAQDTPDAKRGVRGRVVVAPELYRLGTWPITGVRKDALESGAIVRRPVGRALKPLQEQAPALTVMLEGGGLRQENPETPTFKVSGMRFLPGSIVVPRAVVARVQNDEKTPITVLGGDAGPVKIAPGETGDVALKPPVPSADGTVAPVVLSVAEWPFAKALARVLPSGRVLPVKDGEIPLQDIPGGEYTLTFYLGAEPIRQQPLVVPERNVLFIDATVSAKGAADVSIKDSATIPVAPMLPPVPLPEAP